MFGSADDTHGVAMRRLAVIGRQRRCGGSPAGRLRGRQAAAARAITAAVAASAAGPAGVVEVAAPAAHRVRAAAGRAACPAARGRRCPGCSTGSTVS
jgi:hypothetical protein